MGGRGEARSRLVDGLRVAKEQIAVFGEQTGEALQNPALGFRRETRHRVATKDHVERAEFGGAGQKIELTEGDARADVR